MHSSYEHSEVSFTSVHYSSNNTLYLTYWMSGRLWLGLPIGSWSHSYLQSIIHCALGHIISQAVHVSRRASQVVSEALTGKHVTLLLICRLEEIEVHWFTQRLHPADGIKEPLALLEHPEMAPALRVVKFFALSNATFIGHPLELGKLLLIHLLTSQSFKLRSNQSLVVPVAHDLACLIVIYLSRRLYGSRRH